MIRWPPTELLRITLTVNVYGKYNWYRMVLNRLQNNVYKLQKENYMGSEDVIFSLDPVVVVWASIFFVDKAEKWELSCRLKTPLGNLTLEWVCLKCTLLRLLVVWNVIIQEPALWPRGSEHSFLILYITSSNHRQNLGSIMLCVDFYNDMSVVDPYRTQWQTTERNIALYITMDRHKAGVIVTIYRIYNILYTYCILISKCL